MSVDLNGLRRPRLVASDLDGTLLRADGTASARTTAAVRAVQDAGIRWVLVTARPPRWLHTLTEVVGDHGVALCSNGAFVYDVAGRAVTEQHTFEPGRAREVAERVRRAVPSARFAVETAAGFGREEAYFDGVDPVQMTWDDPADTVVGPVEKLLGTGVGKLMARTPDVGHTEFLATVTAAVGDLAPVSYSGATGLAEISAPGVTKAGVLASWCERHDIGAHEVWAFGDMPNDTPMLAWAGTSFAMDNAHHDVRVAATHSAPHHDDDGVARVLEAMLAEWPRA